MWRGEVPSDGRLEDLVPKENPQTKTKEVIESQFQGFNKDKENDRPRLKGSEEREEAGGKESQGAKGGEGGREINRSCVSLVPTTSNLFPIPQKYHPAHPQTSAINRHIFLRLIKAWMVVERTRSGSTSTSLSAQVDVPFDSTDEKARNTAGLTFELVDIQGEVERGRRINGWGGRRVRVGGKMRSTQERVSSPRSLCAQELGEREPTRKKCIHLQKVGLSRLTTGSISSTEF